MGFLSGLFGRKDNKKAARKRNPSAPEDLKIEAVDDVEGYVSTINLNVTT